MIKGSLNKAAARQSHQDKRTKILFAPTALTLENIDRFSDIYCHLKPGDVDTVVVVESQPGSHKKKLPMPSHNSFKTAFGEVPVDDKLRNELCDEDDDFYIDDAAYSSDLSLFYQLQFLQNQLDTFSVLSLQITDESTEIVKELATALEAVLTSRKVAIVFCCDIHHIEGDKFETILDQFESKNFPGLMNSLNDDDNTMKGTGSFLAGLLVSEKWGLKHHFNRNNGSASGISGFAKVQPQPIFG